MSGCRETGSSRLPQGPSQRGVWKLHRAGQSGRETIGSPNAGDPQTPSCSADGGGRGKARVARTPVAAGGRGCPSSRHSARREAARPRPRSAPGPRRAFPPPPPPPPGVWPGPPSRSRPGRTRRAAAGPGVPRAAASAQTRARLCGRHVPARVRSPGATTSRGPGVRGGGSPAPRRAPVPKRWRFPEPPSPPRHKVSCELTTWGPEAKPTGKKGLQPPELGPLLRSAPPPLPLNEPELALNCRMTSYAEEGGESLRVNLVV